MCKYIDILHRHCRIDPTHFAGISPLQEGKMSQRMTNKININQECDSIYDGRTYDDGYRRAAYLIITGIQTFFL